jgi:hypothetical protein
MNKHWLYPLVLACVGCAEKGASPAAPAGATPAGKVAAAALA